MSRLSLLFRTRHDGKEGAESPNHFHATRYGSLPVPGSPSMTRLPGPGISCSECCREPYPAANRPRMLGTDGEFPGRDPDLRLRRVGARPARARAAARG